MSNDAVIPFVDLKAQFLGIQAEVGPAMDAVLKECDFILGAAVDRFERQFADFVSAKFGVGASNGLDALRLALEVLGIGPGDEVILQANTYIASALAVSAVGARPVLVDCESDTYNIDPRQIENAVTSRTKAIMPVHLTGQAPDMDAIAAIARRHRLYVVEDAAQAHGTRYKGRACGSLGDVAAFSFYPGKNLGAYGDGGFVSTNSAEMDARLRKLRNYGQERKYLHVEKGGNARLDTLQAAVLEVKLRHREKWNGQRVLHAQRYRNGLAGIGDVRIQSCAEYSTHVYHLFILETDRREELQRWLTDRGIQTGIHYPIPVHMQPAYADLGYQERDFPNAEAAAKRMLSLPMFPELTEEQIDRVVREIRDFFERNSRAGAI